MKRLTTITFILVLFVMLVACGPSPEEISALTADAETAIAAKWTDTPEPTEASTVTPSPTPTEIPDTSTPTITSTASPTPFSVILHDGDSFSFDPGMIEDLPPIHPDVERMASQRYYAGSNPPRTELLTGIFISYDTEQPEWLGNQVVPTINILFPSEETWVEVSVAMSRIPDISGMDNEGQPVPEFGSYVMYDMFIDNGIELPYTGRIEPGHPVSIYALREPYSYSATIYELAQASTAAGEDAEFAWGMVFYGASVTELAISESCTTSSTEANTQSNIPEDYEIITLRNGKEFSFDPGKWEDIQTLLSLPDKNSYIEMVATGWSIGGHSPPWRLEAGILADVDPCEQTLTMISSEDGETWTETTVKPVKFYDIHVVNIDSGGNPQTPLDVSYEPDRVFKLGAIELPLDYGIYAIGEAMAFFAIRGEVGSQNEFAIAEAETMEGRPTFLTRFIYFLANE